MLYNMLCLHKTKDRDLFVYIIENYVSISSHVALKILKFHTLIHDGSLSLSYNRYVNIKKVDIQQKIKQKYSCYDKGPD
jgi:hypothetical protein